jgi:hypothetical protein
LGTSKIHRKFGYPMKIATSRQLRGIHFWTKPQLQPWTPGLPRFCARHGMGTHPNTEIITWSPAWCCSESDSGRRWLICIYKMIHHTCVCM